MDEDSWRFRHRYLPSTRLFGRTQHWPLPVLGRRPDVAGESICGTCISGRLGAARGDVFVFPTLGDSYGLVVEELMASGLPVITTPNGPGDIVRDGVDGFLVPPRDVEAIVDRLALLRSNPELRNEMGRRAREQAAMFTWQEYRKNVHHWIDKWTRG